MRATSGRFIVGAVYVALLLLEWSLLRRQMQRKSRNELIVGYETVLCDSYEDEHRQAFSVAKHAILLQTIYIVERVSRSHAHNQRNIRVRFLFAPIRRRSFRLSHAQVRQCSVVHDDNKSRVRSDTHAPSLQNRVTLTCIRSIENGKLDATGTNSSSSFSLSLCTNARHKASPEEQRVGGERSYD